MRVINRAAFQNYEVIDEYEAGLVLSGAEAKSAKSGAISMKGSRATFKGDELFLVGMQINPYQFAPADLFEPTRSRKLLLDSKEIESIRGKMSQKGLTLIPLECYTKHGWIKLKLGLVRGKKKYEKREQEKKRSEEKMIQSSLKEHLKRR
jgi:SsrA-binding protein